MLDPLLTAFSMGLVGGVHCTFMCGPLVVGGCSKRTDKAGYVVGRTVAYSFAGALLGALGAHVALPEELKLAALAVLATALFVHGLRLLGRRRQPALVQLRAKKRRRLAFLARLLPRRGLGLGLVTALLPCGVLAGAFMLAAATAHPVAGAGVMLAFAVGSLPGLLVPLLAGRLAGRLTARLPGFVYGMAWCALGLWIGARPLLMQLHQHGGH